MRFSNSFVFTSKEIPADAKVISHQLMLRTCMIKQSSLGIYSWLPLGQIVLNKIQNIIAKHQDKNGSQRIIMPTIQAAEFWQQSGRYDDYGQEMLRFQDRHGREMLYGPTHEEIVTDIARTYLKTYKQLPHILYQIHWKFRDEIRPRFGVMRGREFLMKDAYSFDISEEDAQATYFKMFQCYIDTFLDMGLQAMAVKAPNGPIGGDLSHEFHIISDNGESTLYYDALDPDHRTRYAAVDETYDPKTCPVPLENIKTARGIEVGHIFNFATKYSTSMGFKVAGPSGEFIYPNMGSYGIGVSRLVGAIIEAHHDENGIKWPHQVAPYHVHLINLLSESDVADHIYQELSLLTSVLYDDRKQSAGVKFKDADLLGMPWQVIVGKDFSQNKQLEIKNRQTGEKSCLAFQDCLQLILP